MQVSGHIIVPLERKGTDGVDGKDGQNGADGIVFSVPANVVFAPDDLEQTVLIGAWRDGESLLTSSSQVTLPDSPANGVVGVRGVGFDSYRRYVIVISRASTAYSFDWDAVVVLTIEGVEYSFTIPVRSVFDGDDGKDGTNGITWNVPHSVIMPAGSAEEQFYVGAYRDGKQLVTATSQVAVVSTPTNATYVTNRGVSDTDGVLMAVGRATSTTDVNGSLVLTVTVENIVYSFTIRVSSVFNGSDGSDGKGGSDGKDGMDAVYTHIEASADAATYYPARGAYAPESLTFTAYQSTGGTSKELPVYWHVMFNGSENFVMWYANVSSITIPLDQGDFLTSYVTVSACSRQDLSTIYDGCQKTVAVNTSCALRIQDWDDVPNNFNFEDGTVGCTYLDHVYLTRSGSTQFYLCRKAHTKTASSPKEPTTSTSGEGYSYWAAATQVQMVATKVLLAETAKIENLYADDVYMETSDGKTAIWINPALEGMLIRKLADLSNTGRENQTVSDWSNPTTAFTAKELPEVSDIYGGSSSFQGSQSYNTTYSSVGSGDDLYETATIIGSTTQIAGNLATDAIVTVRGTLALPVTIVEGSASTAGSGAKLSNSQIQLELRVAPTSDRLSRSGGYTVVWAGTADGSGVSGGTRLTQFASNLEFKITSEGSSLYCALYRTYMGIRYGGSITISGNWSLSGSQVVPKYVSQYTAGGAFIGLSSQDYFRCGMNAVGEARHTLLAGGNGVDITPSAPYQYKGGGKMPFAFTLLSGCFRPNGSLLVADYWTFDDSTITLEYAGVGWYVLTLPSAWKSEDGEGFDLSSGTRLCITATAYRDNNSAGAYAKVNNIDGGVISITTHEGDGTIADFPFFLRVDYFAGGRTASTSYSPRTTSLSNGREEEADV